MRYIIIIGLFLVSGIEASAQYYTRDAGFRVGEGFFISYRQFFDESKAVEGQMGLSKDGFKVVALREYLQALNLARSSNLRFLYGYGIHLGVDYTNHYELFYQTYYHDWEWTPRFGIDGIVGLDYAASDLPFVITAAMQPYLEFSLKQYFKLKPFNFVVSFKYRF